MLGDGFAMRPRYGNATLVQVKDDRGRASVLALSTKLSRQPLNEDVQPRPDCHVLSVRLTREAAPQHTYSKAVGVETEALIIDRCP